MHPIAYAVARPRALPHTFLIWQVVGAARDSVSDRPLLRPDFIPPPKFEFHGNQLVVPVPMTAPDGELFGLFGELSE